MSYFDKVTSFSTVTITDQGIDVASFVKACEGLAGIFDSLGSAFGMIKSDIQGNISKVQAKHKENPQVFATLESFVKGELAEKKRPAGEGLLWLKRTLEFTAIGLRSNVTDPNEELSASFTKAYTATLAPFHNFLVRPVFSMAMGACPKRADFYKTLGDTDPKFKQQLEDWLVGLEKVVAVLVAFYAANGIDKDIYAKK
ncbi:glycolipid transfer protein domain-containing protein [Chytriomyces cf. hyalinus JEL632]|nr:glycolipid transfer protein domain-containing protein [Chytriomyces cf. hyalinus JEL632]